MNASPGSDLPPPSPRGWWTRQHTLLLVLAALTALALYACFLLAQPFLPAISWALALAVVAFPLHRSLESKIPRPNAAAAISVLLIALVVVAPASFVVQSVVSETVSGARTVQDALASSGWRRSLQDKPRLAAVFNWIEARVELQETVSRATSRLTTTLSGPVKSSMLGVLQLVITFYLLF